MTAWDLKNMYGKQGKRLCFKNLGIGIYGPASPITVSSFTTSCSTTGLVRAYSDFVIRGLNLQHLTHYALPSPSKEVVITWMARRASVEWPEKRFCSNTDNFFHCEHWAHLGMRTLGRMVRNEEQVKQQRNRQTWVVCCCLLWSVPMFRRSSRVCVSWSRHGSRMVHG